MPRPRLDIKRLTQTVLLFLVLPTTLAVGLDFLLGYFPLFTLGAVALCFPVATFVISRRAVQEFNRVLAAVAPPAEASPQPDADIS